MVHNVDTGESHALAGGPEPGRLARWSTDGPSLLIVEQNGLNAEVISRSIATGERSLVREIRAPDPASAVMFTVLVSGDGDAYAYSVYRLTTNLFLVEGLQ